MKTLLEVLTLSTDYLAKQKLESPRREAELLLSDFLGLRRMDLYLDFERPLSSLELADFRDRLKRRAKGEPGQYIHGQVDFYDLKLKVTPSVLIPRPETEILVDMMVKALESVDLKGKRCLDLCTGSGCIGLALKKRFPDLDLTLSDISEEALSLAKENAGNNGLEVHFSQGDLLNSLQMYDYVVCNPPYISLKEYHELCPEVRDFEPRLALVSGDSGYEFYERLNTALPLHLRPGGRVWLEIGSGQGETLLKLFLSGGWKDVILKKDWAGHDRFILLEIE